MYQKALFIFRRDVRLEDNAALAEAYKNAREVFLVFFFEDYHDAHHPDFPSFAFEFLVHSLQELSQEIKNRSGHLNIFPSFSSQKLSQIISENGIEAVYFNVDYTPLFREREKAIKTVCEKAGISHHLFEDALLHPPLQVLKPDQTPYLIFTPFFKKAQKIPIKPPQAFPSCDLHARELSDAISLQDLSNSFSPCRDIWLRGGRKEALKLREKSLENYENSRNIPAEEGTSFLSAHLSVGTISAREVYAYWQKKYPSDHPIFAELFWRDFFVSIGYHFPYVFEKSFRSAYENLPWENNSEKFKAWKEGKTGYPLVDAGMRQLNTTGYMHNRVRMVTASFLVKDLHIDPRWGEKYFAQKLIDYDPSVNNGNWQWSASTGCDAQPYFRVFSPARQQIRFDPQALYIKTFIPELRDFSAKEIHTFQDFPLGNYPRPIIDHKKASAQTKEMFSLANKIAKN